MHDPISAKLVGVFLLTYIIGFSVLCFFTFYNQAIAIIDWNGLLNKERRD